MSSRRAVAAVRGGLVVLALALVGPATAAAPGAYAAVSTNGLQLTGTEQVAPGVTYHSFTYDTANGQAAGYVVAANLRDPRVRVDLLHPGAVAEREPVSQMMATQGAVAGTNGDFFNISETHAGVAPTNSADGPEIAGRVALKANVPDGQRFGPALPAGTSTQDVFGVGIDRRARLASLELVGRVRTPRASLGLNGFNQYALPVGGIGLYTSGWGDAARVRPTCGTDTDRSAPCSTDTEEVTVRRGVVTSLSATPGTGQIPAGTQVLVGREAGADELRTLVPGQPVLVDHWLVPTRPVVPFQVAVGGFPILRGGAPLGGLDDKTLAVRSAAGASADGRTVYLVALDGRAALSVGLTISGLAGLMTALGATDAVNLDGGGSSELATRAPGQDVNVRNSPSGGAERPVANGLGVFVRR